MASSTAPPTATVEENSGCVRGTFERDGDVVLLEQRGPVVPVGCYARSDLNGERFLECWIDVAYPDQEGHCSAIAQSIAGSTSSS